MLFLCLHLQKDGRTSAPFPVPGLSTAPMTCAFALDYHHEAALLPLSCMVRCKGTESQYLNEACDSKIPVYRSLLLRLPPADLSENVTPHLPGPFVPNAILALVFYPFALHDQDNPVLPVALPLDLHSVVYGEDREPQLVLLFWARKCSRPSAVFMGSIHCSCFCALPLCTERSRRPDSSRCGGVQ